MIEPMKKIILNVGLIFIGIKIRNIIKNYNKQASSVNQFFPTMLKTRVNNGSIYDWFTKDYRDKLY